MGRFVFVLTRGLEDPTRVTRSFQLAKAAKENGHDASMFLTDDAVMLVKNGMLDNGLYQQLWIILLNRNLKLKKIAHTMCGGVKRQ